MKNLWYEEIERGLPAMPPTYLERIEDTLKEIDEMHMNKRFKYPVVLLATLLALALVISGVAIAAKNSTLMDMLFMYQKPSEGTNLPILENLAATEIDGYRLSIDEALYDGSALQIAWSMDSESEAPVFVAYTCAFLVDGEPVEILSKVSVNMGYGILRRLAGAKIPEYADLFVDREKYAGRSIDVKITAHVFTTTLNAVVIDWGNYEEGTGVYCTPEDAARREAAGEIVVDEEGYAYAGRYPSIEAIYDSFETWYVDAECRAYDQSDWFDEIARLDVSVTLKSQLGEMSDSYTLAAPQTITRGDEVFTITKAEFTPASTRIEYEALVPPEVYDPETNSWHGEFDYQLMLTNDGKDPLCMDLSSGWDGVLQKDGNYLIKGFMYGRPMANLKEPFYLAVAEPDISIYALDEEKYDSVGALYRERISAAPPERMLQLNLEKAE